jgi:hypothetical protein
MAITLSLLALAASTAWAGDLTIPFPDFVGGTPAVADQIDANFAAVKKEVDDNDLRIDAIAGNNAGVNWVESDSNIVISTDEATSNVASVALTVPTSGFAIVTASGSIYWQIDSTDWGRIRVKISTTNNDMDPTPGHLWITQYFPSEDFPDIPFSVSKVFPVTSGTNTFYLNMWHSIVNGTADGENLTLTAIFVPNRY